MKQEREGGALGYAQRHYCKSYLILKHEMESLKKQRLVVHDYYISPILIKNTCSTC